MRALAVVALLAACRSGDPSGDGPCAHHDQPSDRAMAACFAWARPDLEQLAKMIQADPVDDVGVDRIGECWRLNGDWGCGGLAGALAKAALPATRYEQYLVRLRHVGGYRVARAGRGAEISIYRAGIVTSGTTKDFLLAPGAPPDPLVPDTDRGRSTHEMVSYAALGDGWYIQHESN